MSAPATAFGRCLCARSVVRVDSTVNSSSDVGDVEHRQAREAPCSAVCALSAATRGCALSGVLRQVASVPSRMPAAASWRALRGAVLSFVHRPPPSEVSCQWRTAGLCLRDSSIADFLRISSTGERASTLVHRCKSRNTYTSTHFWAVFSASTLLEFPRCQSVPGHRSPLESSSAAYPR